MPMSKPMSYDSLRTIVYQADPNFRIHLSQKIPSIQRTDKAVPLRLENLDILPEKIVINGTSYSMEIMEFHPNSTPKLRSITNWREPSRPPFEVDKYGLRIYGGAENLTLGDVKLGDVQEVDEEEHLQELREEVGRCERLILDYDDQSMKNHYEARAEFKRNLIKKYLRRSEGRAPRFRYFMVFKTSVSQEILEYDGNLSIALKYMSQKLLEARVTIEVKNLYLESGLVPILRLPESIKFKVENLDVFDCQKPLSTLEQLIFPTSFPLKALIVDSLKNDDSEFLNSAQLLIPRWSAKPSEGHGAYSRVHYPLYPMLPRHVMDTIQSWKQEELRDETHVSFSSNLLDIENTLKTLQKETGAISKEGSVILPFNDDLEILCEASQFVLPPVKHLTLEPHQFHLKVRRKHNP